MRPHYRQAAHRLLDEAYKHLATHHDRPTRPLHELLARLVIDLHDRDQLGDRPPSLGGTVDEAAACLLNLADPQQLTCSYDEDLTARLGELDCLPRFERLRLLESATRHTVANPTQPPARVRSRTTGPCPCPCNNGGFCGGCGHAGCGGHR